MLKVAKEDLTVKNAILCIIQHPNRKEKKVEAGHLLDIRDGRIAYNDIGTIGGSSGAPILDGSNGEIVGVHIKGRLAAHRRLQFRHSHRRNPVEVQGDWA